MTRNELLELANTFYINGGFTEREIAFARVIAAAEREACLKLCKEHFYSYQVCEAIRARGNT